MAKRIDNNGASLGFEAQLWAAADKLRGSMEPSDYKHVALGLIFLKYISDAFEAKRGQLLKEVLADAEDPEEYLAENVFWVPREARWSHLRANARQASIGKIIDDAMLAIEAKNESLKGVLPKDYGRPALNDYIGIAQNLKSALGQYSRDDRKHAGIDGAEAIAVMLEKYEIVCHMFHGFDYRAGLTGSPQERLVALAGAIEWVLDMQQREAARESTEEGRKQAYRRFSDAVLALSKAFALASASDEAKEIRDAVGFFQTVRAALAKSAPGSGKSSVERDFAVQQIISRAVISTEIVDILEAAGLQRPDISILSDEFLAELQGMEKKNLALEALRKLINGEIHSRSQVNVVQTRAFSERLEEAIARYHINAITTAEVIQELIKLAKDIRAAHQRGEEEGLSQEEIAFYDALAQNESAVEVMGNDQLRVIAHELLSSLQSNATVDWQHRKTARARMRVLVKHILRKHGYPPDLQEAAVQTVLQQAEVLAARWAA